MVTTFYRYMITSIIGLSDDIGVENLSAAGMIAGETSKAYDEVVTMSLVSGRAIGIGKENKNIFSNHQIALRSIF